MEITIIQNAKTNNAKRRGETIQDIEGFLNKLYLRQSWYIVRNEITRFTKLAIFANDWQQSEKCLQLHEYAIQNNIKIHYFYRKEYNIIE